MMPVINIGGGRQTGRTTRMLESVLDVCACVGAHQHDEDRVLLVSHCFRAAHRALSRLEQMALARGYKPMRGHGTTLCIGAAEVVFTTPDDREIAARGAGLPSSEFWDHFAVEVVHDDRLRLKDQVYRLMKDVATLKAQRDEAKDDVLKLRLEAAEMCREREKALDSRKAAE